MSNRDAIVRYCNDLLSCAQYKDYCPNGLQIEGKAQVRNLVSGVSACQALLDAAIAHNADMILVHHGYFWKNEARELTGYAQKRIRSILQHDINLLAYHLPLDGHGTLGNNAQLAKILDWLIEGNLPSSCGVDLGRYGRLKHPCSATALQSQLHQKLQHAPLMIAKDPEKTIQTIAWCSGAAGDDIHHALALGVDAFVTGEPAERLFHIAQETGIAFYAAGHHATERFGVQALGDHLAARFDIQHHYIDIPCPI